MTTTKDNQAQELITPKVARRVAQRLALGLPLDMALAAEDNPEINPDTWADAIEEDPASAAHAAAAQARFCEDALARLVNEEDPKWLCWVLENCHPTLLQPKPATAEKDKMIAGLPADVLARAREYATHL